MNDITNRITPQWLAGFFDGEGCVTAWVDRRDGRKQEFMRVSVEICQKDELLMATIHSLYPESHFSRITDVQRGKRFTAWKVKWHGKKSMRFLSDIMPYLICKRDRAELAYRFCELITKRKRNNFIPADVLEKRNGMAKEILRINGTYKTFEPVASQVNNGGNN